MSERQEAVRLSGVKVGRVYSYLLIVFGTLSVFFGIVWIHWPLLSAFPSTFINVYPVPPSPSQTCYGVLVPFPYPWSCPPSYQPLPSPFDTLPILSVMYFAVGGSAVLSALTRKVPLRTLILSLSVGLVATALGSDVGYPGNHGWPINWFLYPISQPPGSNYFPVFIVVPAFLADLAMFSLAASMAWVLPFLSRVLRRKQKPAN